MQSVFTHCGQLFQIRYSFVDTHSCVPREEVIDLIRFVVRAYGAGVVGGNINASIESTNWDIASSVFFAGTVITTIGMFLSKFVSGTP